MGMKITFLVGTTVFGQQPPRQEAGNSAQPRALTFSTFHDSLKSSNTRNERIKHMVAIDPSLH